MADNSKVRILTPKDPVARIVGGSVSRAQEKDADGKPYVIKNGPKAGQPTVKYYIALAIPKGTEQHWAQTPWGQQIWAVGHAAFPQIASSPHFAWKIDDGDSTTPNTKGKRNCDNPNYRGSWILHCSTSLPIKGCNADGSAAIPPEQIKTGYYVQVAIMCQGNGSSQKPGVYLNPEAVALQFAGEEIVQGLDTSSVGFGGAVARAGTQTVPNVLTAAQPAAPSLPGLPPVPGAYPAAPGAPAVAAPVAAPPAPVAPPAPNTAILGPGVVPAVPGVPPVPGVPAAPVAPPAPPPAPAVDPRGVPTVKAAGATIDQMLAWPGWGLELLKANGYIQ